MIAGLTEELDYGNARLRAMRSRLFDRRAYDELMRGSVEDLLAALGRSHYRPDVEAALSRASGLPCLYEALRQHLARTLRAVQSFYAGEAARGVALLRMRYDVANLVTILRGRARGADPSELVGLLVPAGSLDDAALLELARQHGLRETIDTMVMWRVPSARTAARLLAAVVRYQRDGDLAALEHVLLAGHAEDVAAELAERGGELGNLLRGDIDRQNLLAMVRLWEARARGELERFFLPGGRLRHDVLAAASLHDSRDEVVRALPREWAGALARWSESGDRLALSTDLERARVRAATALFVRGDPLSIAIPVAFIVAKETEVRNLRAIGNGLAAGLSADDMREALIGW